ncbi:MAG: ABC transporter permease [Lactobacillaceae bacterium]|jgi:peptide/nickel transport system permease protein|nr:ABC transporter permease [Lactobacillaceae bacterium]
MTEEKTQNDSKSRVSFLSKAKREFSKDKVGLISLIVVVSLLLFIFIAAIFIPTKDFVNVNIMDQFLTPGTSGHILGTDDGGRDELAMLIVASRNSLFISISFTVLTTIIGLIIGLTAGYFGGGVDWGIMRLTEFLQLLPTMMLVMVVVTIVSEYNAVTLILIFTALSWMSGVRFVRSLTLTQSRLDYVKASKLSGASPLRTMLVEILPNLSSFILADLTLNLAGNIGMEVGLSYLGFGLPASTHSLGTLLQLATDPNNMTDRLWVWLPSAIVILLFTIAIVSIGQVLRRVADQRQSLA